MTAVPRSDKLLNSRAFATNRANPAPEGTQGRELASGEQVRLTSTVGRSEPRDRGNTAERQGGSGPSAFQPCSVGAVPNACDFRFLPKVVNVPVRAVCDLQVMSDAGPYAARAMCAAEVEIERQVELYSAQASDAQHGRCSKREKQCVRSRRCAEGLIDGQFPDSSRSVATKAQAFQYGLCSIVR